MHNNYYFLRQISSALAKKLEGFTLVSCFSQSKDELVFEFNNSKSSVFIRASLLPELSCLTFPKKFMRARKNSVDLFDEVVMKAVTGVRQFSNERSFAIDLEGGLSAIFKMHGNYSNVLLAQGGKVIDIFRSSQMNDLQIDPENLDKVIDWSKEAFVKNIGQFEKLYFTFGKSVWHFLKSKGFEDIDVEKKWTLLRDTIQILENPDKYFIYEHKGTVYLSLLPFVPDATVHTDPFEAVNAFAITYAMQSTTARKVDEVITRKRHEVKATGKYLQTAKDRLAKIEGDDHFKAWGDILMANLHLVATGANSVTLENFYDENRSVDIPLDPTLSPQKNAERYYRKSKNRVIEIGKLKDAIQKHQVTLDKAELALNRAMKNDPDEIKSILEHDSKEQGDTEKKLTPFWEFEYKGFTIWVGRDAKNNDELTTRWAHKNDLWLHARGVPGSHVVVRHKPDKIFPTDVVAYAGSIAAWNSKRKTESLCQVIVTEKKYVRKRKGDPAGAVIVDREEVILVEPRNPVPST